MEIIYGVQPNCSELIIRLPKEMTHKEIIMKLKDIGIREAIISADFLEGKGKVAEWDDESINYRLLCDLPKEHVELIRKASDRRCIEEEYKEVVGKLTKLGYGDYIYIIQLIDAITFPDPNYANIGLNMDFDGDGPAIVGHQHCQPQLFPLLNKISEEFICPVEPYDGGSVGPYEEWIAQGKPNPKDFKEEE